MKVEVLSIFPDLFQSFLESSLVAKAIESGKFRCKVTNIRDFAKPPHHRVDDSPYGGGPGMVFMPEPLALAIEQAKARLPKAQVVLLSASGNRFTQSKAKEFSQAGELILVCGRYEGVDQRIIDLYIDQEISIGDYVLMGGEIPAMAVIEASLRLVDGVLGNQQSIETESFSGTNGGRLEAPQYTKPAEFQGQHVPAVLLSGNHSEIESWRNEQSALLTKKRRPDLAKE